MRSDCLIEIGTEELPPKDLKRLSDNFADLLHQGLIDKGFAATSFDCFATPRRLAVLFHEMPVQQAAQIIEKRGPAVQAAFDAEGNASKAAAGFARSCGVAVDELVRRKSEKGEWLYFEETRAGMDLDRVLPELVTNAVAKLPIAKRMRWGSGRDEFVRPVKWLVMMIGSELVQGSLFGVESAAVSFGHRFHAPGPVVLKQANDYEALLRSEGMVIASFEKRREAILKLVKQAARELGGDAHIAQSLLDEVTALVEYPVAVCGKFDAEFLELPPEALVITMQDNQKYFALFDQEGGLLPHFITIANIDSLRPDVVATGNERVIRPRFSDARFFFEQDKKSTLASLRPRLDKVVFQFKLGSIGDKSDRIAKLGCHIAKVLNADQSAVSRAAILCKCDLMTEMVGEFPKLQGVMGRYYAMHDQETDVVSQALEQHYWPKFAGDDLPVSDVAQCIALADRIDSLVGIFAIGQKPSGMKDPFALRRAALSVVRIIIEKQLSLDLHDLCQKAAAGLQQKSDARTAISEVIDYIFDRLRAYYREQGISFDIVDAVISSRPANLLDSDLRVHAVQQFQSHEAALALAAANKRISNILKKQSAKPGLSVDASKLQEDAEIRLYELMNESMKSADVLFSTGDYLKGLNRLAVLREPVDRFFDEVMVMVEDESIRNNRLALLGSLLQGFQKVADFSRIQS